MVRAWEGGKAVGHGSVCDKSLPTVLRVRQHAATLNMMSQVGIGNVNDARAKNVHWLVGLQRAVQCMSHHFASRCTTYASSATLC